MPSRPAPSEVILPDLRYASVHGLLVRGRAGAGAAVALAALLAGCAAGAEPRTFAVPSAAAARIRMACPPGSFVGTMTANCPQILPAAP